MVLKSCVTAPSPAVVSHLIRAVLSGSSTLKITHPVWNSLMHCTGHQSSCNLADSGTFPNTYVVVLYGINSQCHMIWHQVFFSYHVRSHHIIPHHLVQCNIERWHATATTCKVSAEMHRCIDEMNKGDAYMWGSIQDDRWMEQTKCYIDQIKKVRCMDKTK